MRVSLDKDICACKVDYKVASGKSTSLEQLYLAHHFAQEAFHLVVLKPCVFAFCAMPAPKLSVTDLNFFLVFRSLTELLLDHVRVVNRRARGSDVRSTREQAAVTRP